MSTVTEIKEAIDRLTPREYCELMSVLHPFEDDDWDRQMNADAAAPWSPVNPNPAARQHAGDALHTAKAIQRRGP